MIFTEDEVKSLNEFQKSGIMHPFTCGKCSNDLIATTDGWKCEDEKCDYVQDWAHDWMKIFRMEKFQ